MMLLSAWAGGLTTIGAEPMVPRRLDPATRQHMEHGMGVYVTINVDGREQVVEVSDAALRQVRMRRIPGMGHNAKLDMAFALGAAAISNMEALRDGRGEAGRCAALAITQAETATMYAVKALTADLPAAGPPAARTETAKPSAGVEVTRAAGADGAGPGSAGPVATTRD